MIKAVQLYLHLHLWGRSLYISLYDHSSELRFIFMQIPTLLSLAKFQAF